jgi:hypothetical protein
MGVPVKKKIQQRDTRGRFVTMANINTAFNTPNPTTLLQDGGSRGAGVYVHQGREAGRIVQQDYRDRQLVPSGLAYKPTDFLNYLLLAENGDTRYLNVLYDDLRARDPHLDAELSKAEDYLTGARVNFLPPRRFRAGNDGASGKRESKLAQDICSDLEDQLLGGNEVRLDLATRHFATGLWKGIAGNEVESIPFSPSYSTRAHERIVALRPIPSQRFRYLPASTTLVLQQTADIEDYVHVEAMGDRLALLIADKAIPSPARRGIMRRVLSLMLIRLYGPQWWARFVELFGSPMRVGKTAGADLGTENRLKTALQNMGSSGWAIIPDTANIEFIESMSRTGGGTPHELLMDFTAREISKVVLGATQTTDVQRNTGSRSSAQVHHDVTVARSFARAIEISAVFRSRILMPYVCRNYGMEAALKFTPEFRIRVETRPDMYNASQSVKMLLDAGMQTIPVSWVHDILQIPVPVEGEPVVVLPLMPGLAPGPGVPQEKRPKGPVPEGKPEVNDSPGATSSSQEDES